MKIYLSRSTTRSMMADYPIGDPTGGPAYGEKRDPISAAISIFSMYTSGAALAAEGFSLMAGLTFAGGAMSLIGNITGNKTLSSIGMIAGLAGGFGTFAENAGWFGEGNTLVGALTKGSSVDISSVFADSPAPSSLTPVVDGVQAAGPGTNAYLSAEAANPPPSSLSAPSVNTAPTLQTPGAPAGAGAPTSAASSLTRSLGPAATAPSAAGLGTATAAPASSLNAVVDPFTAQSSTGLRVLPGDPTAATKPTFMDSLKLGNFGDAAMTAGSGAMAMLKDNPTGAYVAAKGIGAAVDYLSGKTDAELDQLKANTGYYNAKALETQAAIDREIARRANKNMAYNNIDAGIRVKQPGLIASNMQST